MRKLSLLVVLSGMFAVCPTSAAAQDPGYSLRAEADRAGINFGSAAQWWMPQYADPEYAPLLDRQVNTITFENELKWRAVHPAPGVYDFTAADVLARWAEENGMVMRGHPLLWYFRPPEWLSALTPTRDEAIEIMRDHIHTVVGHFRSEFPGLVVEWDVINEGMDNDGTLRSSLWQRWIGDEHIDLAFRFAREAAGPGVELYFNEYFDHASMASAENAGGDSDDGDPAPMLTPGATGSLGCAEVIKCTAVRNLVAGMLDRGVPIDGVGFQAHMMDVNPSDHRNLTAWVNDLGIRWALTEMDRPMRISTDAAREWQAAQLAASAQSCVDDPACNTIVLWGLSDEYSWWRSVGGGFVDATAFDDIAGGFAPKPAADALHGVLAAAPDRPVEPVAPAGQPQPTVTSQLGSAPTGKRAAALRKCKKKRDVKRLRCRAKAKKLPL
jgi:endo-1,4-beta-xylanase